MNLSKNIKKNIVTIFTVGIFILLATGSTGPYVYNTTNLARVPIHTGIIKSDIKIVAVDNRFELMPDQQFSSPFQNDLFNCPGMNTVSVLEGYSYARACGAADVKVYIGDDSEPLYGVLALNNAVVAAYGHAARSYLIKIPTDKFMVARQGNTTVAFETMTYRNTWTEDGRPRSSVKTTYSWILWLSRAPLGSSLPPPKAEEEDEGWLGIFE